MFSRAWTGCSEDVIKTISPRVVGNCGGELKKGQQECLSSNNAAPKVCLHTGAICCSSCATWNPAVLFEFQQGEGKCWLCNHHHQGNGQKQNTSFTFSLPLAGQPELLKLRSFNQRLNDEWHYFLAKTIMMPIHKCHGSPVSVLCFFSSPSHQSSSDSSHRAYYCRWTMCGHSKSSTSIPAHTLEDKVVKTRDMTKRDAPHQRSGALVSPLLHCWLEFQMCFKSNWH